MSPVRSLRRFTPVFISSFFLSIHYGAILYANSSLLSGIFAPSVVSLLFLLEASCTVLMFLFAPKLIEKFGKRPLLFIFLVLTLLSTPLLVLTTDRLLVAISFIIYASLIPMIYYFLDIFLEEQSKDNRTGEIRGVYLSLFNIGIALGPLVLAMLAEESTLKPVYIAATLLLIPPILLSLFSFRSKTPKWHNLHHPRTLLPFKLWWRTKNVRRATLARLSLETFFAFMVIYTPIYLHNTLGFDWSVLGIMFTIMLLPFVLLQWPVGELADRFVGEKEFMIIGFLVMGTALCFMPYLAAQVAIWTAVLFISRVGASIIEVTTESYFFKHVDAGDAGLISIFRLARPISIVLGTVIGTLALSFISFNQIFFVVVVIVFLGLKESLLIRDTL